MLKINNNGWQTSMTVPLSHLYRYYYFCVYFTWIQIYIYIYFNWLLYLVPKVRCAHKCSSGRASDPPARKRRGSMQRVLQSSSLACRGSLLQPAHTAPPQRSVLCNWFTLCMLQWDCWSSTHCFTCSSMFDRAQSLFFVCFADLIDPLRYQPLYRQKYVLNERGETLTFIDCEKQSTTKLTVVLCIGNIASNFNISFFFVVVVERNPSGIYV